MCANVYAEFYLQKMDLRYNYFPLVMIIFIFILNFSCDFLFEDFPSDSFKYAIQNTDSTFLFDDIDLIYDSLNIWMIIINRIKLNTHLNVYKADKKPIIKLNWICVD